MAKHVTTVISDFWVSKFAQYTYYKISPAVRHHAVITARAVENDLVLVGTNASLSDFLVEDRGLFSVAVFLVDHQVGLLIKPLATFSTFPGTNVEMNVDMGL